MIGSKLPIVIRKYSMNMCGILSVPTHQCAGTRAAVTAARMSGRWRFPRWSPPGKTVRPSPRVEGELANLNDIGDLL
jgi:hypothetical protein